MKRKILASVFGFLLTSLVFWACGKNAGQNVDQDLVRVEVEVERGAPDPTTSLFNMSRDQDYSFFAVPTRAADFTCMAVNIVGPGIPSADGKNEAEVSAKLPGLLAGTSSCTYPGILSQPIYGSGSQIVALDVAKGASRVIQVVGGVNQEACNEISSFGVPKAQSFSLLAASDPKIYELGRAVVDLFSNQTVSIGNTYDSSTDKTGRSVDCGDGGCATVTSEISVGMPTPTPSASVFLNGTIAAQSFTVTNRIRFGSVEILATPTPGPSVVVQIKSNNGGEPGSEILRLYQDSTYPQIFGNYNASPFLDPGVYWLVVTDSSNVIAWIGSSTDSYSGGTALKSTGSWGSASPVSDFSFRLNRCF